MFYRTAAVAVATLAGLAAVTPATAHPAHEHTVRSGQSIQAALDAARPGDTVTVLSGVYRENLGITKNGITLRGRGARLVPPATAQSRRCSENFGLEENPFGICISGVIDPDNFEVRVPVRNVTVDGFTVTGFGDSAIIGFGTANAVIKNNDATGGPTGSGYGVLMFRTTGSKVLYNRTHDSGGAGIYIGSSLDARALVAHNVSYNNGFLGLMVRDSVGGTIEHNLSYGNCRGLGLVDGGFPGTSANWLIRNNVLVRNTRACPDEPNDVSGVGILLAGAHANTITRNVITDNAPTSTVVAYSGGIILAAGGPFGGTGVATGNTITNNVILRNAPADLNLVETGPGNTFAGNVCGTSRPAGHC
jgi:hypothetical protein